MSDLLPDASSVVGTRWGAIGGDHQEVVLLDLETREVRPLLPFGFGARYVSPGYLLFGRASSLMAVPFDLETQEVRGEPLTVVAGAAMESLFGMLHGASSGNGLLAYAPGGDLSVGGLAWVDLNGTAEFLTVPERVYGPLDLSPDQGRIAVAVADVQDYVWIWDVDRAEGRRVVSSTAEGLPSWSGDGRRLMASIRELPTSLALHPVDASGTVGEGIRLTNTLGTGLVAWSPEGSIIAMVTPGPVIAFVGVDSPVTVPSFEGNFPAFSPDGRWLAYQSGQTGTAEVFIRSYPEGREVRQVSNGGGIEPRWKPSGELYYRNGDRWYVTTVSTDGEQPRWEPPRLVFETNFIDTPGMSYDVSADGRRLLVVKRAKPVVQSRIEIVTNWPALMEASGRTDDSR